MAGHWFVTVPVKTAFLMNPALRDPHQVAGVGFHHQPDFASLLQVQRITRGQREVNFHFNSTIHFRDDDHVPLLQRDNSAGKKLRALRPAAQGCQQNVAGADSHPEL